MHSSDFAQLDASLAADRSSARGLRSYSSLLVFAIAVVAAGCGNDDSGALADATPTPKSTATSGSASETPTPVEPTEVSTSSPTPIEPTAVPTSSPTAVEPTAVSTSSPTAIEPTAVPTSSPTAVATIALQIPPEVTQHRADWPLPNRDYGGTRATFDATIDSDNVTNLEVAWRTSIPESGIFGNLATTPLILGDTVYVQALSAAVFAIDFATGEVLWRQGLDGLTPGPNGPVVGYGRVFATTGNAQVVALDADTGERIWSTSLGRTATEGIDIQPVLVDGKVYVSTVPVTIAGQFIPGDRGIIHALDAETGAIVWSFDTVASDDLWGHPEINSGGGAWYPPAVDVNSGTIFWGIGNAAPFPGTDGFPNGSSRLGPNLYMTSTVALRARSGELAWYNQVKPHDLFDHDFQLTMFGKLDVGGEQQDTVIGTGKTGTVHAFDPSDGQQLWKTSVGLHSNDELEALPLGEEILVSPGLFGGVLTPPAMADGIIYVAVLNMPTPYEADTTNPFAFSGRLETATGEIVAIDGKDGAILWTRSMPAAAFGGATVVNDLVFTSTYDGTIYALRRSDGETLWTDETGKLINGWPAVAGDTVIFPIGGGNPGEVVAYRLGSD